MTLPAAYSHKSMSELLPLWPVAIRRPQFDTAMQVTRSSWPRRTLKYQTSLPLLVSISQVRDQDCRARRR